MYKKFANNIIQTLGLPNSKHEEVYDLLHSVSYYKLIPYIDFINNKKAEDFFVKNMCKSYDNWDLVVYLYEYNVKLSASLYPYVCLFENVLKTRINNELCKYQGFEWYTNKKLLNNNILYNPIKKYLTYHKKPELIDFVENESTLSFWNLLIKHLWDEKDIKLMNLFAKNQTINPRLLKFKQIYSKLESIRRLRNDIFHYNQIIGCKIYKNYKIFDIYKNMYELFELMNYEKNKINSMLTSLHHNYCENCKNNSFEALYNEILYIQNYEIKSDKTVNFIGVK